MKTHCTFKFFWLALSLLLFGSLVQVNAQTPCTTGDAITTKWEFTNCAPTAGANTAITGGTVTTGSALTGTCNISSGKLRMKRASGNWVGTTYDATEAADIPFTINTGKTATIESISIDIATGSGTAATGYKLQYSTDGGTVFADIAEVTGTGTKIFTFASPVNLGAGNVILRFMAKGSSSSSRNLDIDNITIDGMTCNAVSCSGTTITAKPTALNAGTLAYNQFTVTWTAPIGAATYDVELYAGATATGSPIDTKPGIAGTTATFTGLTASTQYTVKVIAKANGTTYCGTTSETLQVTTPVYVCPGTTLGTSAMLTPSVATETGFTATWAAVPNASSYTIKVYQGATTAKTITGVTGTTTVITGLSSSTAYTFAVQAIGNGTTYCDGGETGKSAAITTLVAVTPPPSSPCGSSMITRYTTDFSDWITQSGPSSQNQFNMITEGGGVGFQLEGGVSVHNTSFTDPACGQGISATNASRRIMFPSFNFIAGGVVSFDVQRGASSDRGVSITPSVSGMTWTVIDKTTGSTVISGTGSATGSSDLKKNGNYTIIFTYPASFTGDQNLSFTVPQTSCVKSMSVCTNPGSNCQLSTNPMQGNTINFLAEVGGKTKIQYIDLKGFNLTGDVQVAISGGDAGRFTIPNSVITKAIAMGATVIPVTYTSSVLAGAHDAVITFTSAGCATPISINLHGSSIPVGGGCALTTSTSTLIFATRLIMTATNTIVISGVNLTGNVSLSLTGANPAQFSLSQTTVPSAQANASGKAVTITYTGGTAVGTHNANLVITNGSCSVTVPLIGNTMNYIPYMYTLTTIAQPPTGGTITTNIAGPQYPSGTIVKLTAVAEAGYKFVRWSDISSYSPTRNITMNANKTIIAIFEPSTAGGSKGDLEAYNITSANATGFTANWKAVTGATQYTIKVYEQDANGQPGTLAKTQTATGTSVTITGLTTGKAYFYQVEANSTLGDTSEMMGSYPIGTLQPIICGQDN